MLSPFLGECLPQTLRNGSAVRGEKGRSDAVDLRLSFFPYRHVHQHPSQRPQELVVALFR